MSLQKKKVLFTMSRLLDGGIDIILLQYLRGLDRDRYDVSLAIATDMGDLEVHRLQIPEWVKVHHLVSGRLLTGARRRKVKGDLSQGAKILDETLVNPLRRFLQAKRLRKLADDSDAVVDFDASAYTLLKGTHTPVIGFYHFSIEQNLRTSRKHTLRQMAGMHDYKSIVLICDAMVEEGKRLFPELASKFTRIYNGYNLEDFRNLGRKETEGETPLRKYFISVARLEESQKDITTLLRAYAVFRQRWAEEGRAEPCPALRIIGKGRDEHRLKELAHHLGLNRDAVFMGFVANPAPWIARAEALVLSSNYEGFGMVLLESLILGRATISSDCPVGPAEILEHGRAGILVTPGSAGELADAMWRVATQPVAKGVLESQALASAERFDIDKSIKALECLIQ